MLVVGGEHPHRLGEHDPADRGGQVAPADADDLRDADPGAVEQARGLLRAGPGRGDDADAAGAHDVGEPEPDRAEHRGAAARAHDQQAEVRAAALELDLVALGDVVGEEEDVQALGERAVGLEGRVLAGDGDQRDVGVGQGAGGGGEGAGRLLGRAARRARRAR